MREVIGVGDKFFDPDGSLGAVFIGEFAGDREKDLRLTYAQARTLAAQIVNSLGAL